MSNNAFFWIASEKRYIDEAIQSAESVKRHMPGVPLILFCPEKLATINMFNAVIFLPARKYQLWYLDFVGYLNFAIQTLDHDKLIYLDTDTYMCAPVPELFDLLDAFDIASTYAPARTISPTTKEIPECFPEFNTGVLVFENNDYVQCLFEDWLKLYENNANLYGENDQAPLRELLLNSFVSPYVLPPEYNCRFGFGGQAAGMIKILHGRSPDIAALAQKINEDLGIRGWRRGDYA